MMNVYVDAVIPAGTTSTPGTATVTVTPGVPVAGVDPEASAELELDPPSPNPSRAGAAGPRFRFALARAAQVRLEVLDLAGRRIATLFQGPLEAGSHEARWDGAGADGAPAATGLYFVRLRSASHSLQRKLLLLR
jgi:hypothetical protein